MRRTPIDGATDSHRLPATPVESTARPSRRWAPSELLPPLRGGWDLGRTVRLTVAAVVAFVVARVLFPGAVPVLAPLTALLVVEVTLKDIVTSGLQRIASVTAGVLVAVGFLSVVGLSWWSLGILLAVAIVLGQVLRLGPHAMEVPISAMLVLAVGGASAAATDRILETLAGAAVGVLVSAVFPPAVRSDRAADAVHRYARELALLLSVAAEELRRPVTEAQAARWMQTARDLSRQVPRIDQELQDLQESRRLNARALAVPDTGRNLRAELDSLEHTTVAVRSMFRSVLDGVRDDPNPDPDSRSGAELRQVFSALIAEIGLTVKAFGDLAHAEGTTDVDDREVALAAALAALRSARDRIDDLALIEAPTGAGWQLSEPVRLTVERVLRDLDTERTTRRRVPVPVPLVPPRFVHVPATARRSPWTGPSAGTEHMESTAQLTARLTALRFDPATGTYGPVGTPGADSDRRDG